MREILFRGRTTAGKEWVSGFYAVYSTTSFIGAPNPQGTMLWFAVDPATVGQFTGLTDKNGKRIFEGDIVKGLFLFEMEVRSVVTFMDGAFCLLWQRGNVSEFSAFTSICNVEYEVVGNVHDNGWEGRRDEK